MNFPIALTYNFLIGFLALGLQQVWARVFSFSIGGSVVGFGSLGFMLALVGLGVGAFWGYRYCKAHRLDLTRFLVKALFLACVFSYILMPLYSNLMVLLPLLGFVFWMPVYAVIFTAIGTTLPIMAHTVKRKPWQSVGRSTGWLMSAFLGGAALSPWMSNLVFSAQMPPEALMRFWAIALGVTPVLFFKMIDFRKASQKKGLLKLGAVTLVLLILLAYVDGHTSQKMFFKNIYNPQRSFAHHFKSIHGNITAVTEEVGADSLYVNGAYHGRLSFDPVSTRNRIQRIYYVTSLHPDPSDVLQINLSNGAWSSVIAGNPSTSSLTIVDPQLEIRKIIDRYSEIKPILHDEKIDYFAVDGRRWLRKNPQKKFDMIVVNTAQTHEDHITHLLSEDFIQLAKRHLKEGGLLSLNSTGCDSVYRTMANAFPYVTTVDQTVVGAFGAMQGDDDIVKSRLESFRPNGTVVFDSMNPQSREVLETISQMSKENQRDALLNKSSLMTDNNMWCEYKEHIYVREINQIKNKVIKMILGD
tara:strand:- start:2040 stop:3623 length:1584 start_codon:yes stop_codon:yes gene_type:complete